MTYSFPRHSARTRRFSLGEPRSVAIRAEGGRLLFLRSTSGSDPSTGLWLVDLPDGAERLVVGPGADVSDDLPAEERARRERVRETAAGIVAYSADTAGRRVAFAAAGVLTVVDVDEGTGRALPTASPVFDPHLDPTGERVAYAAADGLRCVDVTTVGGSDRLLAGAECEGVSWGRAEHVAAEEMGRTRGFWWSPDGRALLVTRVDERRVPIWWIADPAHPERTPHQVRYPAAGMANADVSLHLVGVDGSRVDVDWDRAALPYLARVVWSPTGPPLLQVQSRDQRRVVTLAVDTADGSTSLVADDRDDVWVELFDGVPAWWDGRCVRIVDRDGTRSLVVGTEPVTGPDLYVRAVSGVGPDGVVFTASADDPTQVHVLRWSAAGIEWVTTEPGVHRAVHADGVTVVSSSGLGHFGTRHRVVLTDTERELTTVAEQPEVLPDVRMLTVGERALRCGLVLPHDHRPGRSWPVLLSPYAGPHAQRVLSARAAWLESQWLADQGFAVLVVDGRGTPGRGPQWEREVAGDLSIVLEDQVDALQAVAALEPALDLRRVAIRGWSFGGYLAALAVLRRPDVFAAAVAGAPVTDWALYDTHYTERYLGDPTRDASAYRRSSLLADAHGLTRPLLLIHGLADDNVVAAHSLLLSQRLTESGHLHNVLPLTGVTHMTPQEEVAENLLLLQVRFLHDALGP